MKSIFKGYQLLFFLAVFFFGSCATSNQLSCPTFETAKVTKKRKVKSDLRRKVVRQKSDKIILKKPKIDFTIQSPDIEKGIDRSETKNSFLIASIDEKRPPAVSPVFQNFRPLVTYQRSGVSGNRPEIKSRVKTRKNMKKEVLEKGIQISKNENIDMDSNEKTHEFQIFQSDRKTALIKGGALLLMAILAGISMPVLGTVTASIGLLSIFLLDILIGLAIIRYYKQQRPKLSKITGVLRLIYTAVFGIGIGYHIAGDVTMFNQFWQAGLIVFGIHLIALGILFNNEGGKKWVNLLIKSLLIAAGIGYLIIHAGRYFVPNPIAFESTLENIFIVPMILGEVLFAIWMIIRGGKTRESQLRTGLL